MAGLADFQRIALAAIGEREVIQDETRDSSYLGTPVFGKLFFESVLYENQDGTSVATIALSFDTAIVSVSQKRNIITTSIQGRSGTVKEYISQGDYTVSIDILVDTGELNNIGKYPTEVLKDLRKLLDATIEIPIASFFLNDIFDVLSIVVTDYSIPQVAGQSNIVPVRITAISEPPEDIILKLEE